MTYLLRLLCSLGFFFLVACTSTEEEAVGPYDGHYVVTQILDSKYPEAPARVNIVGDVMLGQGPVNQWSAAIRGDVVSGMNSSRRAGPAQHMQIENALLKLLNGSQIDNNLRGFVSFKKDGRTVVILKPVKLN